VLVGKNGIRARWRVAWISKGRVISKDFDGDLGAALELLDKAKRAGKSGATLICTNKGFEPPEHLLPRRVEKVRKVIVKRGGKRRVKREIIRGVVTPLKKLNATGVWWCPYCVKLRKFVFKPAVKFEGKMFPEPGYYCPVCGVGHKDWTVRHYNPVAQRMYDEPGKLLKSGTSRTRRRSTRRRRRGN
jgi:hypothetical protein